MILFGAGLSMANVARALLSDQQMRQNHSTKVLERLWPSLEQRFQASFAYDVHFTNGLFHNENLLLAEVIESAGEKRPGKVLVVIDDGLVRLHPCLRAQIREYFGRHAHILELATDPLIVPGGEKVKMDPDYISLVHEQAYRAGLCRHSYVMAIGGGAVLDMAGFAAATAHRGVRLLRVPTTVLSQNDSGIGVKNGTNAFGKKNFLGTFAPPYAVFNDFEFLSTLDPRDWRSGIAEAVKVALIKDSRFFSFIEHHVESLAGRDMAPMQQLIYQCARLHMAHISGHGDPFETGSSRPLDFGHWAAHKLEQLSGFRLRHGEAVAIGIALDCTYSQLSGRLSNTELRRILSTLNKLGFRLYESELKTRLGEPEHPESLFAGLEEFREHLGGHLTLMLLSRIGVGVEVHEVDLAMYRQAVDILERAESAR